VGGIGSGRKPEGCRPDHTSRDHTLRPAEYRVPDRLREPSVFELVMASERILKRAVIELSKYPIQSGLCDDIRGLMKLFVDGQPAIERARALVAADNQRKEEEAERVRKTRKAG